MTCRQKAAVTQTKKDRRRVLKNCKPGGWQGQCNSNAAWFHMIPHCYYYQHYYCYYWYHIISLNTICCSWSFSAAQWSDWFSDSDNSIDWSDLINPYLWCQEQLWSLALTNQGSQQELADKPVVMWCNQSYGSNSRWYVQMAASQHSFITNWVAVELNIHCATLAGITTVMSQSLVSMLFSLEGRSQLSTEAAHTTYTEHSHEGMAYYHHNIGSQRVIK